MHWLGPYVIKEITDGGVVQVVKLNGEPFPGKLNGSFLKPYTDSTSMWLDEGSIVLVLQADKRRHETINYTAQIGELRNLRSMWSKEVSQGL